MADWQSLGQGSRKASTRNDGKMRAMIIGVGNGQFSIVVYIHGGRVGREPELAESCILWVYWSILISKLSLSREIFRYILDQILK